MSRSCCLAALLTACAPGATWSTVEGLPAGVALSGVGGSGPDDVWLVGGDADGGRAFHGSGDAFAEVDLPAGSGLLVWVVAFAPDDAYAVGRGGTALRWDGSTWTPLATGTTEDLWGVWGADPTELWVVGGQVGLHAPTTLHGPPTALAPVVLADAQNDRHATSLFKVWGIDGSVWAVGERGLVLQWTGDGWNQQPAGAAADDDLVSLWGTSADRVVAVGGRASARIATWDGQAWTTVAPDGVVGLNAIHVLDTDRALVGGTYGYTATLDLTTGALTPEAVLTALDVHAAWSDGAGRTWAVGGNFQAPYAGVALLRTEAAR